MIPPVLTHCDSNEETVGLRGKKTKMKRTGREGDDERGDASERKLEVEKCVGGKETRERKTDGDLRATVTPGLVLFIQGSRH